MNPITSNKGVSSISLIALLVAIVAIIIVVVFVMSQPQESQVPLTPLAPIPETAPVVSSTATIDGLSVETGYDSSSNLRYVIEEISFDSQVMLVGATSFEAYYELYDAEGKLLKKSIKSLSLNDGKNSINEEFEYSTDLFSIEPMNGTLKVTIYDGNDEVINSAEVDVTLGPQDPVGYDAEISGVDAARFELGCQNEGYVPYFQPSRSPSIFIQNLGDVPIWGKAIIKLYADDMVRAETGHSFFSDVPGTQNQLVTLELSEWVNIHYDVLFSTPPETIMLGVTIVDDFSGEELVPEQDTGLELIYIVHQGQTEIVQTKAECIQMNG